MLLCSHISSNRWPYSSVSAALVLVAALLCTPTPGHAQTTWINLTGNGLWSSASNWTDGVPDFLDAVTFPSSTVGPIGTVTLSGSNEAKELLIKANGYTLNGGSLYLDNGRVTMDGDVANIFTALTGSSGLTKLGFGVINTQGDNSYFGDTTISGGVLDVSGFNERIPDNSNVIMAGGTQLRFFNGVETIGSLSGGGQIIFGNSAPGGTNLQIGANNASTTYSGNSAQLFGGTARLTKIGSGTLALAGSNNYTLGTTVSGGRLVVNTVSLPASNGVVNNATLEFNQTFDATYSGVISGTGQLVKSGAGKLILNQTNTYSGGTRIEAGTLAIINDANLGSVLSPVTFDGGTLRIDAGAPFGYSTIRPFTIASGHATFDFQSGAIGAIGGGVSGLGGLVKNGPGVMFLDTTPSTYTGPTIINQGQFSTDGTERLPNTTDVTINSPGFWAILQGTETIDSLNGTGQVQFAFGTFIHLFIGADGGSGTYGGNISLTSGGTGQLTKIGSGTQTLTGINNYNLGTTVSGGRLVVNTNSLPASHGVANYATLEFNQPFNATYAGVISGGGQLIKSGNGTLSLNQNNLFNGNIDIEAGTLAIPAGVTSSSITDVLAGGTLRINGGQFNAIGVLNDSGDVQLTNGTLFASIMTVAPGGQFNFTGGKLHVVSFTGDLTNNGGTVTPGGLFTDTTNINGNFTQTPVGATQIKIAGTTSPANSPSLIAHADPINSYDQLLITGSANLAGLLAVDLINGFFPTYGDTFTILAAADISGSFTNRNDFIDAIDFIINGQDPGVFRLDNSNFALVPLLKLDPSGAGGDTVTLITTAPGDINLDGTVNIGDFLVFQNNFNDSGNWFQGDFNGDGLVNIGDFLLFQNNFNDVFFTPSGGAGDPTISSGGGLALLAAFAVAHGAGLTPEPTTAVIWLVGTIAATCGRRKGLVNDRSH